MLTHFRSGTSYGAGGGVELPFGGVGKSGHGREKGFYALYGFIRALRLRRRITVE